MRGADEVEEDGRVIGWRVYLVPWMFTKRPLAVKNPLMVICFWEFHWSLWRLVGAKLDEAKSSEFCRIGLESQIAVIASLALSYLISF